MAKKTAKKDERIIAQTKGSFQIIGKVTGVERDKYYIDGIVEKGKNKDKNYRSMNFGVKTSDNQTIYLRMYAVEPEFVWVIDNNPDNRKKGEKAKVDKVTYEEYTDKREAWQDEARIPLDMAVNLESTDPKASSEHFVTYDGIDYLYDNLENGMTIYVKGDLKRNSYENRQGEVVDSINYEPRTIKLSDKVMDESDAKFYEYAKFKEEFILTDTELNKEEQTLLVYGKTADYAENLHDAVFEINYSPEANGLIEDTTGMSEDQIKKNKEYVDEQVTMKQRMIKAFKKLKYGTLLLCEGKIINKVIVTEEEAEDDDDLFADLRGSSNKVVRDYVTSMRITGTESYTPEKYSEEEVMAVLDKNNVVEDIKDDDEDDDLGDLRGESSKSKKKDDFGDDFDDFDESDLPF